MVFGFKIRSVYIYICTHFNTIEINVYVLYVVHEKRKRMKNVKGGGGGGDESRRFRIRLAAVAGGTLRANMVVVARRRTGEIVPGDQRHGDRKDGHVLAAQQVLADVVLFAFHAAEVEADGHGQTEHGRERGVLDHPAELLHGR